MSEVCPECGTLRCEKFCRECRRAFHTASPQAIYCSPACRKRSCGRASRERSRGNRLREQALAQACSAWPVGARVRLNHFVCLYHGWPEDLDWNGGVARDFYSATGTIRGYSGTPESPWIRVYFDQLPRFRSEFAVNPVGFTAVGNEIEPEFFNVPAGQLVDRENAR